MSKLERNPNLSEQMELARKRLEDLPEWQRANAHFAGSNHGEDSTSSDAEETQEKAKLNL